MGKRIALLLIVAFISLTGCSSSQQTDKNETVNATIELFSSGDELHSKYFVIPCKDAYYGVQINNKAVNYHTGNNYFVVKDDEGSKTTVQITDKKVSSGTSEKDGIYTEVAEIDNGVYLIASGSNKKLIGTIFNNVFKTDSQTFQIFGHDIDSDWCKEITLDYDIVSFSNGEDTVYIYANEGSTSEGSWKGRTEPTVFYKQLRGIDIPITYPEDDSDAQYYPYGYKTYDHATDQGYTPFSAYGNGGNCIILANNDKQVLSLFDTYNERLQPLYSYEVSGTCDQLKIDGELETDISEYKTIARDIVDSDNRYHFGFLTDDDENQTITASVDYSNKTIELETSGGYYLDQSKGTENNGTSVGSGNYFRYLFSGMDSYVVIPTAKLSSPGYDYSDEERITNITGQAQMVDSTYALIDQGYISTHGSYSTFLYYLAEPLSISNQNHNINYIMPGDYVYRLVHEKKNIYYLEIYEVTSKEINTNTAGASIKLSGDALVTRYGYGCAGASYAILSCSDLGTNSYYVYLNRVSKVEYLWFESN